MRVLWTTNEDPERANSLVFIEASMTGLEALGVHVTLDCIGPLRSPSAMVRATRALRARAKGFDLLHAQYGSACALVTSQVPGIRKLVTIRGSDWSTELAGSVWSRGHKVMARAFSTYCLNRFDHVITVSRRLSDSVSRRRGGRPLTVLPSALDVTRFRVIDRAQAREALGCGGDDRPWVLFTSVSRSNPVKRLGLAEEAVALATQECPGLCLKVVSDVPHEQVPLHVAACNVILCTSVAEGWPNSVKEALACGLPFVATDVSDLSQLSAQLPACCVCEATPEALARGLVKSLSQRLTDNDRIKIAQSMADFGTDVTASRLAQIYRSVVGLDGG